MYSFLQGANYHYWNTDFKKGESIVSKSCQVVPSSALLQAEVNIFQFMLTGEDSVLDEMAEKINNVEGLVKKYSDESNHKELAGHIAKFNAEQEFTFIPELDRSKFLKMKGDEDLTEEIKLKEPEAPMTDEKTIFNALYYDVKADQAMFWLFKGLWNMKKAWYVSGAYLLQKSWSMYKRLYKVRSGENKTKTGKFLCADTIDKIEFGYGTFLFIISIFPDIVQVILRVVGFISDRKKGTQLLRRIVENQGFLSGFSAFLLAVNYVYVPSGISNPQDNMRAFQPIINFVLGLYPKSAMLQFLAAQFILKQPECQTREAIGHFQAAVDTCGELGLSDPPNNFLFELGYNYFIMSEYDKTVEFFESILEKQKKRMEEDSKVKGFQYTPVLHFLLACCYSKLDKPDKDVHRAISEGLETSSSSSGMVNKFIYQRIKSLDVYCIDDVEKSSKKREVVVYSREKYHSFLHLVSLEFFYLRRDIAHFGKDEATFFFDSHQGTFNSVDSLFGDNMEVEALSKTIQAQLYRCMDNVPKCRQFLNFVTKLKLKREKQCVAYARYELGELLFFEKKYEEALKMIKLAGKGGGFPFQEVHKARVGMAVRQIQDILKK